MDTFTPGTSRNPASEVELTISCKNLADSDVFSVSDPMCVVLFNTPETSTWQEIFRTEVIANTLNPSFAKKPVLTYHFEIQQLLEFKVFDVDSQSTDLRSHDFLGSCKTTLGQIVSSGTLELPLQGGKNKGEIIIKAEELVQNRDEVILQFQGHNIRVSGWYRWFCSVILGTNSFLELSKVGEDGEYSVVYRTEKGSGSGPRWKQFTIPVRSLCGGDIDRDIRIRCYHYHHSGDHALIGEAHTNLRQLSKFKEDPSVSFSLTSRKRSGHSTDNRISLIKFDQKTVYTFLDYITSGTQINCTFAIDFTASNGDPSSPDSLHYFNPTYPNEYEQAIKAVGEIIQDYDSDKMYPVLGFGARLPPDGRISHEFYVNMHPSNPYCQGIDGVLEAYRKCLPVIQLYGPTNFSPVINHIAQFARAYANSNQQYFILLIVTDGVITDMELTIKAIVQASTLPLSIIIVGVGNADFSAMDRLDADTVPLSYNGEYAFRDIVQFVPFRNFSRVPKASLARAYLAKEVLAEVPRQFVEYMKHNDIKPGAVGNTGAM